MSQKLRFDDKVAIVTGAGGGLGRSHALLLASRGAKVVVNDLGGSAFGDGKSATPADKVVAEIVEAGGTAVANYDSVEDGKRIVEAAMDTYGRIDIVINNAGILRDVSFHKMTPDDWDLVYRVHVKGSFAVTHAAWPHLRNQHYGRVIMTASAAGIYGNFGQANYAMAKLGLTGFANTLAVEGIGRGIHVNTIAPIAGSRLTETVLPKDLTEALQPEVVSPLVAWLCHEDCEENGGLYEVGGGFFAKLRWERAAGQMYRVGRDISVEALKSNWDQVVGFETTSHPTSVAESMGPIIENVNAGKSRGGNEFIDVDAAVAHVFEAGHSEYDTRDVSLYALGVGAAGNPLDSKELELVYELHGSGMKALPTFGVIPAINNFLAMAQEGKLAEGFNFGLERILHGEQRLRLERPLPSQAKLRHETKVSDVLDKGKHALITLEVKSYEEDGDLLATNDIILVVRGAGGWGGDRGSSEERNPIPDRAPDATRTEKISEQQALLYRLSGDWNPLHADPDFAKAVGFDRPILHGLCTYGYACRHVVDAVADGNPQRIAEFEARMSKSVFPGDTLTTEMWKDGESVVFRSKVEGRDGYVLTAGGARMWTEIPQKKAKAVAKEQTAAAASSEPQSQDVFTAIEGYLQDNAGDVTKIGKVFQFRLRDPAQIYTIDLKSVPPKVLKGEDTKPDTTLELTDNDFLAMCAGSKDAMKMYMDGELKIGGDLMASQKLTFLQKIEPERVYAAAAARGGSAAAPVAKAEINSQAVFAGIDAYVKKHPELAEKIQTVYAFELSEPDSAFTLDLKTAPGAAMPGAPDKADCTLKLKDATFMAMVRGEADPMKLFMDGDLKVSGNIMASQKLDFLTKIDPAEVEAAAAEAEPQAATASAAPKRAAIAIKVFAALESRLKSKPGLAEEVRAKLQFKLTEPEAAFVVDLSQNPPSVSKGVTEEAKATFTLSDEDLAALVGQTESAQFLYQQGRMRVDGEIQLAQRLGFLNNLV